MSSRVSASELHPSAEGAVLETSTETEEFETQLNALIQRATKTTLSVVSRRNALAKILTFLERHPNAKDLVVNRVLEDGAFARNLPLQNETVASAFLDILLKLMDPTDFERLPEHLEMLLHRDRRGSDLTECRFTIFLCSLRALVRAKSSLVVMSGLQPSLFKLLFEELHISDADFISRYSKAHMGVLILAVSFVEIHDFFAAISDLHSGAFSRPLSDAVFKVPEARNSKYLSQYIAVVMELVKLGVLLPNSNLKVLLKSIIALRASCESFFDAFIQKPPLVRLRVEILFFVFDVLAAGRNTGILAMVDEVAHKFVIGDVFSLSGDAQAELFWQKIALSMSKLSEPSLNHVFKIFRPSLFARPILSNELSSVLEKSQQTLGTSSYSLRDFLVFIRFLLNQDPPLLIKCSPNCVRSVDFLLRNVVGVEGTGEDADRWRYAINQLALFCVENRMKTTFGKPLETFNALGSGITPLLSETTCSDRLAYPLLPTHHVETDDSAETTRQKLLPVEELLRVNCFLSFIDVLDKLMFYADRGCMMHVARISDGAKQFFVLNFASCQSWISRISFPVIQICYKAGRYAQAVRLATAMCSNLKLKAMKAKTTLKMDDITLSTLILLIKVFVQLSAPQSIRGVRAFAVSVFNKDLEFTSCAEAAASGQYENALLQIDMFLAIPGLPDNTSTFLTELRLIVVKKLRSPLFLKHLDKDDKATDEDTNRAMLLVALDEPDGFVTGRSGLNFSLPWEIERRLEDFEFVLIEIASKLSVPHFKQRNRPCGSTEKLELSYPESQLQLLGSEISNYLYVLNSIDVPPLIYNRLLALESLRKVLIKRSIINSNSVRDVRGMIEYETLLTDNWKMNTVDRLSLGEQLYSWEMKLGRPMCDSLWNSQLALARIARKTSNIKLARYHIGNLERIQKENEDAFRFTSSFGPPAPPMMPPMNANGYLRPQGGQMFVPPSFMPMPPSPFALSAPVNTSFMLPPPMVSPMILNSGPPPSLQVAIESAKLTRLDKGKRDDGTAFFTLSQAVCAQDLILCSPSVSPAPGMTRSDPEFVSRIIKLRRAITRLGSWAPDMTNGYQRICETNKFAKNPLWDMVIKRFNILSDLSSGAGKEQTLQGALYWVASEVGGNLVNMEVRFAKAHRKMAEWCFDRLFRKDDAVFKFSSSELASLHEVGISTDHPKADQILKLLSVSNHLANFKTDAQQLLELPEDNFLDQTPFVSLWKTIKNRQTSLFDIALRSQLTFLTHIGDGGRRSIHTVTATLHILKMLVSHPELFEVTTNGRWLLDTNEKIWRSIIPQLFARLNHPNDKVRNAICDLLKKIGASTPHAVCFPAVVGAYYSRQILVSSTSSDADTPVPAETLDIEDDFGMNGTARQDRSLMSATCLNLVESLQQQFPELIKNVMVFVKELQRINMLHEEKWMFVLNNLDREMSKRIRVIEAKSARTMALTNLAESEKLATNDSRADSLTKNIQQILVDLYHSTCEVACDSLSINETRFRDEFSRDLASALSHFSDNRIVDPKEAWLPFKKLASVFNHRANKRSYLNLLMKDMSPVLAELCDTAIPIPGQELSDANIVTIREVKEQVTVMLTKTRPKKIAFIGSDGKEYLFLFKGQEDLRLDERVMQLLDICNLMLTENKHVVPNDAWPPYLSRNYSVTPLGVRSGLIRWVDGATPMFQIYRKWRSRQIARDADKADRSETPVALERPMDLFFKHLKTVFQELNLSPEVQQDRKKWPLAALSQVLERLIDVTPRDILARELWMVAGNCDSWWRITQRFVRSVAVASMVGSMIGLGDRHMENLLVNLTTGEVIHIDYNICFDKGRHLQVPETVPFRLTGNIIFALGPTQIEGMFRQSCEHVISVLRDGKETLLAMLDAFVYDPLVDWAMQDQLASGAVNVATILAVYGADDRSLATSQPVRLQEEENTHAKLISRRIRRRLEGRELLQTVTDSCVLADAVRSRRQTIDAPMCVEGPEMTPAEQVDMLIRCATSHNNLAFMYEGWTAWV